MRWRLLSGERTVCTGSYGAVLREGQARELIQTEVRFSRRTDDRVEHMRLLPGVRVMLAEAR